MHHLAVIRSVSHGNANHVQASLAAMTGHAHPPEAESRGDFPPAPTDFPPVGAVQSRLRKPGPLPTWVQVGPLMRRANGTVLHGQLPGFLGARHGPLVVDQDLQPSDVRIAAIAPDPDLSVGRLADRQTLLEQIDGRRRLLDHAAEARTMDGYQRRAFDLIGSPDTRRAFDLAGEPAAVRDRYGRTEFGQACLLARRLAEAGVPVINVHYCRTPAGSWDTHGKHFAQMKESLCPTFDRAFAALVADLDERGLLDRRWSWPTPSSGGRRGSTPAPAATTGRSSTRSPWRAGGSAAGWCTGRPTRPPHSRRRTRTTRGTWLRRSTTCWASRPTRSCRTRPPGPTL